MVDIEIVDGHNQDDICSGAGNHLVSPADSFTAPLSDEKCEMCGRLFTSLHSHHTIPRSLGGANRDIIQVCISCHRKADAAFENYIMDPHGLQRGVPWSDARKKNARHRAYSAKYIRYKTIDKIIMGDKIALIIGLFYNLKNGYYRIKTERYYLEYYRKKRVKYKRNKTIRRPILFYFTPEFRVGYYIQLGAGWGRIRFYDYIKSDNCQPKYNRRLNGLVKCIVYCRK